MSAGSVDLWAVLLPVIVGGLLALLPGVVVQIITHILSRRAERDDRRRHRLEQLFVILSEYEVWLNRYQSEKAYGIGTPVTDMSPWAKITAIATIDFPRILPFLGKAENAASQYHVMILSRSR